jgi:hypothetical protein
MGKRRDTPEQITTSRRYVHWARGLADSAAHRQPVEIAQGLPRPAAQEPLRAPHDLYGQLVLSSPQPHAVHLLRALSLGMPP